MKPIEAIVSAYIIFPDIYQVYLPDEWWAETIASIGFVNCCEFSVYIFTVKV